MDKPVPKSQKEKTFVVSLKGMIPWISKVYYEKTDTDLNLYFALKDDAQDGQHPASTSVQTEPTIIVGDKALAEKPPAQRLLAAALPKKEYVERAQLHIFTLSKEDFSNAQANPTILPSTIQHLRETEGGSSSFLFLFENQTPQNTKGLLWSPRRDLQDTIMLYGSGEGRENWVLFSMPGKTTERVKQVIKELVSSS